MNSAQEREIFRKSKQAAGEYTNQRKRDHPCLSRVTGKVTREKVMRRGDLTKTEGYPVSLGFAFGGCKRDGQQKVGRDVEFTGK